MSTINMLFCGDYAPIGRYEELALSNAKLIFGDLSEDISNSHISFLNLEVPLCVGGEKIEKSGPHLSVHPDCIEPVVNAGFDVIGLANNHILDYGQEGLVSTLKVIEESGIAFCGAGSNIEEAMGFIILEKKGVKVAIIAIAENECSIATKDTGGAAPVDIISNVKQIELAKSKADIVFVTIHGGNEYFPYPRPGLRRLSHFFIDQGVDGVICHHPHIPGAYEFYNNKPIIYSLGNLIFDNNAPPKYWNEGYAVRLEYDIDSKQLASHEIIPYTQSVGQGGIEKMLGEERELFLERVVNYMAVLKDDEMYAKEWNDFCESKKTNVLMRLFFPFRFRGLNRLSKILPLDKMVIPSSQIEDRRNLVRCESHRELLLKVLEDI